MARGSEAALRDLLLAAVCLFSCCSAQVTQTPDTLATDQGDVATMSCSFTSTYRTFQWYRQLPGLGPVHLLTVGTSENFTAGRFIGERLDSGRRSSLHISASQPGDSGSYLCAVDAQ